MSNQDGLQFVTKGSGMTSETITYDYIFGFGSIINTETHAPWLGVDSQPLKGQSATIAPSFGYRRGWNFRSNTGFTALGIVRDNGGGNLINGVLFRIPHTMLSGFDRREVGYTRLELDSNHLIFDKENNSSKNNSYTSFSIRSDEKIWVYVPNSEFCAESNEDHPILQSYVDTVMQGCLQWGGIQMARQFVETTDSWSSYFLNDTPSSRRPWLFRKEYNTIDAILRENSTTYFTERKHPEEFASAFLIKMMRGSWSVPRRNASFTGRDLELAKIHSRMIEQTTENSSYCGLAKVEVVGMGGVGKTQLCVEYCYRYSPSYYGLVIWLSAQGAESIVACFRQLMADTTGVDVREKDSDEVVSEVKARLFRSNVPWLMVFDNLDDRSLLEKFVPHGGTCGHVLITTRSADIDGDDESIVSLGCFNPSESVQLLCRSANVACERDRAAAGQLADCLGHLPLALSMAAAYMRRCDVDCSEYLSRYLASEKKGSFLGHEIVASSLSMSLNAIQEENLLAWETLRLLAWLGPNQITKSLVRALLCAKQDVLRENAHLETFSLTQLMGRILTSPSAMMPLLWITASLGILHIIDASVKVKHAQNSSRMVGLKYAANYSLGVSTIVATYMVFQSSGKLSFKSLSNKTKANASIHCAIDEFEQTDVIWKLVKSYSLIVVKNSKGSIHRLLSQALRLSQSESDSRLNLEICLRALRQTWKFKPEQIDSWHDSAFILDHVKSVIAHSFSSSNCFNVDLANLAREAGIFSAMALNRFEEAKEILQKSLDILNLIEVGSKHHTMSLAATHFEMGKVLRYQGSFQKSEESLHKSLELRLQLSQSDDCGGIAVAATLHELGVLEVKRHNLDAAANFLQKAIDLRRTLREDSMREGIEAERAATLHQLAAVHLARKPPSLQQAEMLLQEALALDMQIGQRAATLKQLARVAIRRGEFVTAEKVLAEALNLYVELYGENVQHVNVAAVKFQQGSLAFHRDNLSDAWKYYSECLNIREKVYEYIQGNHIDISSVLHELGRVAFSQKTFSTAQDMLQTEKQILDQLCESADQSQRIFQARLTNLMWLQKCAKELGDEITAKQLVINRNALKHCGRVTQRDHLPHRHQSKFQQEAMYCRSLARQLALSSVPLADDDIALLKISLETLVQQTKCSKPNPLQKAIFKFHQTVSVSLSPLTPTSKCLILDACDNLRDVLRDCGCKVSDEIMK